MKPIDKPKIRFQKSSFCSDASSCIMVAFSEGQVLIQDSKDPESTTLCFSSGEWKSFLKGVKAGEFDIF